MADDAFRNANQALIAKRAAWQAHLAARSQALTPLKMTRNQLESARKAYVAKITQMNATNAKERESIGKLDHEITFELRPRQAAVDLLAKELDRFLGNPERAINAYWTTHPKFNLGNGRAMRLLPATP